MRDKMIVMTAWLDKFGAECNEEQKKEICYRILQYGLYEVYEKSEDEMVNLVMNFILPQIDTMQENYESRVSAGKQYGRPKVVDNVKIWRLAQQGKNGKEIAAELGYKEKTLYSAEGWKMRKNPDYLSENL